MGRSVISHRYADAVAYDYLEPDEEYYRERWEDENEDWSHYDSFDDFVNGMWSEDAQFEFDAVREHVVSRAMELWPSLEATDRSTGAYWDDEQTVILENQFAEISISEFGGAIAISLAARTDLEEYEEDYNRREALAKHWRSRIADRFVEEFGTLTKLGTFSNGESVFEKRAS